MRELELLIRGAIAGFAISAPVGPVNVLCISRTLTKGRIAGIISGVGAAVADTIYGAIAGFSISFVISWMIRELFWLRMIGGLLLIAIGAVYWFKRPKTLKESAEGESTHSELVTTFLLTLTNPTTVLSFLAVLAILGLGEERPARLSFLLVLGILAGAMVWWVLLAMIAGAFRKRFNDRSVVWMNRIAACAIAGFGLVNMILAARQR
ncbi:MAG TPA: LysE family transporter [Bryobacteraceae bacterium]|jgi:threonine/homoserine/homoserine lactone efflux protein|nr:LysE family transporter [Bryobacteraceae bacterium]